MRLALCSFVSYVVKGHQGTLLSSAWQVKYEARIHEGPEVDNIGEKTRKNRVFLRWVVGQSIQGNALFLFFFAMREQWGQGEVQDGCPLAQVTLWMMRMERCLVQLSTLH